MIPENSTLDQGYFWECYLIEYYKKIRLELKAIPEEAMEKEKDNIFRQLTYMNLFLQRLIYDPGLYHHLCNKLLMDKTPIEMTEIFLNKCIYEDSLFLKRRLFNVNTSISYSEVYPNSLNFEKNEMPEDLKEQMSPTLRDKIDFLMERFNKAESKAEYDEAGVIKLLIQEYLLDKKLIYRYIDSSDYYVGNNTDYTEKWDYKAKKFSIEKINYYDIYQKAKVRHTTINPLMLGIGIELKFLISILINHINHLSNEDKININFGTVNEIIIISSIIWFNNLPENEKIEVLNNYYPFKSEYINNEKDMIIKYLDHKTILNYIKILLDHGMTDTARILCQAMLNTKGMPDDVKCSCHTYLGNVHEVTGTEEKMLRSYTEAFKLAKKHSTDQKAAKSSLTLCLHIIAYVSSKTNEIEFIKWVEEYRSILESLPKNVQDDDVQKHMATLNYLDNNQKVIFDQNGSSHIFANEKFFKIIPDRAIDNITSNVKPDIQNNTGDPDNDQLYDFYSHMGSVLFDIFQFDIASYWFKKAQAIKNDTNIQGWFGIISYYSKDYPKAREIFNQMIKEDDKEISAHIYLGALDIKDGAIETGLEHVKRIIEYSFSTYRTYNLSYHLLAENYVKFTTNAYIPNMRYLMKELLYLGKKTEMLYILEKSADFTERHISRSQYYEHMGSALSDMGLFDDGKDYYFKALASNPSDELKPIILCNLGSIFANQDLHKLAIPFYKQAIEHYPEYHDAWQNKAISEIYAGMASESWESINKAMTLFKEKHGSDTANDYYKRELQILERQIDFIAPLRNLINVNMIPDEEIKSTILTAEFITLKMERLGLNFRALDFSIALVEYGKSLEQILHKNVSLKIREKINEEFGSHIKRQYWDGGDGCDELRYSIRNMLNKQKNRTIPLGDWNQFISNVDKPTNNPVYELFKMSLIEMFTVEEREKIKVACITISDYRNGSAHYNVKKIEEVYEIRHEIISLLRGVIEIIYKNK